MLNVRLTGGPLREAELDVAVAPSAPWCEQWAAVEAAVAMQLRGYGLVYTRGDASQVLPADRSPSQCEIPPGSLLRLQRLLPLPERIRLLLQTYDPQRCCVDVEGEADGGLSVLQSLIAQYGPEPPWWETVSRSASAPLHRRPPSRRAQRIVRTINEAEECIVCGASTSEEVNFNSHRVASAAQRQTTAQRIQLLLQRELRQATPHVAADEPPVAQSPPPIIDVERHVFSLRRPMSVPRRRHSAARPQEVASVGKRCGGMLLLLDARAPYRSYGSLALLREAATASKLLPPEPFPFTPCPSPFNKIEKAKEAMKRKPAVPEVRPKRADSSSTVLRTLRAPGATHLTSVLRRIEQRFDLPAAGPPTQRETQTLLRVLDEFSRRNREPAGRGDNKRRTRLAPLRGSWL